MQYFQICSRWGFCILNFLWEMFPSKIFATLALCRSVCPVSWSFFHSSWIVVAKRTYVIVNRCILWHQRHSNAVSSPTVYQSASSKCRRHSPANDRFVCVNYAIFSDTRLLHSETNMHLSVNLSEFIALLVNVGSGNDLYFCAIHSTNECIYEKLI